MRTRTVLIFCLAAVAIAASGCGGGGDAKREGDEVVAAFYPLAFLAEQVAPDAAVRNLTPPGAEPHDLELSPRDVAGLREARRVLYLGGGFMPSLEDAVEGRANAVDLLAGVEISAILAFINQTEFARRFAFARGTFKLAWLVAPYLP